MLRCSEVVTLLNSAIPEFFWPVTAPRRLPAKSFMWMAGTRLWGCKRLRVGRRVLPRFHRKMDLYLELVSLLGAEITSQDSVKLEENSQDKWFASHLPDVVVEPKCTDQVSRLLRFANQRQIPVTARGAGFGYVGGCVPVKGGIALSLAKMNRIKEIAVRRRRGCCRARRDYGRSATRGEKSPALLSTRSGEPEKQLDRWKYCHQCRRASLPQIWRDPALCPGSGSRSRRWHCRSSGRANSQEQNRIRSRRALRRIGRDAGGRD